MEHVALPPDVFRRLCCSLEWCHIENDQLIARASIPLGEEDSNEMLLLEILRKHGPVMRRRDLWQIANGRGIEKVSFDRLLSESNIIVRHAPEVYGLIGSDATQPSSPPARHSNCHIAGTRHGDELRELGQSVSFAPGMEFSGIICADEIK